MNVIITGGSCIKDYSTVARAIKKSGFKITGVISGCCVGADRLGERYATEHGLPLRAFPLGIGWSEKAIYIRNEQMIKHADAVINIVRRADSADSITAMAKENKIKVFVYETSWKQ